MNHTTSPNASGIVLRVAFVCACAAGGSAGARRGRHVTCGLWHLGGTGVARHGARHRCAARGATQRYVERAALASCDRRDARGAQIGSAGALTPAGPTAATMALIEARAVGGMGTALHGVHHRCAARGAQRRYVERVALASCDSRRDARHVGCAQDRLGQCFWHARSPGRRHDDDAARGPSKSSAGAVRGVCFAARRRPTRRCTRVLAQTCRSRHPSCSRQLRPSRPLAQLSPRLRLVRCPRRALGGLPPPPAR